MADVLKYRITGPTFSDTEYSVNETVSTNLVDSGTTSIQLTVTLDNLAVVPGEVRGWFAEGSSFNGYNISNLYNLTLAIDSNSANSIIIKTVDANNLADLGQGRISSFRDTFQASFQAKAQVFPPADSTTNPTFITFIDSARIFGLPDSNTLSLLDSTITVNLTATLDSDGIKSVISGSYLNSLTIDADTLNGQNGSYYLNYNNLINKPTLNDSVGIDSSSTIILINQLVDSAYVQARQTTGGSLDSNSVNTLINTGITNTVSNTFINNLSGVDADLLNGQSGSYYLNYNNLVNKPTINDSVGIDSSNTIILVKEYSVDSQEVINLIDSSYVQARQTTGSGGVDSNYVTSQLATIDSNYIIARDRFNASSIINHNVTINGVLKVDSVQNDGLGFARITSGSDIRLEALGEVNVTGSKIVNLKTPTADSDAANKIYVDSKIAALVDSTGVDSAYVASQIAALVDSVGVDSNYVTSQLATIDSNYIRSRQILYNTSNFTDSSFVTSFVNNRPVSTFANDKKYVDSANVQSIITPLYIQQRQTPIDSDLVTSLVDSAYIQLRDRFQSDSNFVTNIVDTSYIQSKQLTFDFLDSAEAINLIDSSYVQARQTNFDFLDSGEVINLIDSSYVQARQTSGDGIDSAEAINLIDSSYVQARQTNIDSSYVQARQTHFDASTVLPIAGGTMSGDIRMSSNEINLAPTNHSDATISFNQPGDNIVIRNHNTGGSTNNINIDTKAGSVVLRHVDTSSSLFHPMVEAKTNGSVDLYYDNSKKIETTTTGATVTGTLVATAFSGDGSNLTGVQAATVRVTESTDNNATYNVLFSDTTGSGNVQMTPIQDDGGLVFNPGTNLLSVQYLAVDNGAVLYGHGGTNRVGIGTTSPAKKLHIRDTVPDIRLEDTNTNAVVDLKGNTGTGSFVISTDVNNAIADSKIIFEVDNDEKVRIDSGGNVGIGTTSPSTPLHVVGNNGILIDENGGGDGQLYFGGISGSDRSYIARNADDFSIWNVANGTIKFGTSNDLKMTILANGNVGIGETNPDGLLHVRGGTGKIMIQTDGAFAGTGEAMLDFRHYDDTGDPSGRISLKGTTNYTGDMVFKVRGGGTSGGGGAVLQEHMRIKSDNAGVEITRTSTDQTVGLTLINEQAGGYGSGIVFKSKRTDTSTLLAAAEIRVQGENSWNGAGNVASQIQFASQRDGTLTDQMVLTKNGVLHTYGNSFHINSGQGTVSHMNEFQFLTTEVTPTSSGSWLDVCYVSHSPCLRFHGMSIQGNNASYGGARFIGSVIGTYGSVVVNQEQKRVLGMNGGDVTDIDYRYLNSGAPSGSYRLQVKLSYSGGAHKVYTVVYGNATARISKDGT